MLIQIYLFEDDLYVPTDFQEAVDNCNRDYGKRGLEIQFAAPIQIRDAQSFRDNISLLDALNSHSTQDGLLFFDLDLMGSGFTSKQCQEIVESHGSNLDTIRRSMRENKIDNANLEAGFWLLDRAKTNSKWRGVISVVSGKASPEPIVDMLKSIGFGKIIKRISAFPSNGTFHAKHRREDKLREALDKYLMAFGGPGGRLHPPYTEGWF